MSFDSQKPGAAEAGASAFNQSCFDLMLIELVPMAQRIAEQLFAEEHEAVFGNDKPTQPDDEDVRQAVYLRLGNLGYRVGQGVAESLTENLPLPSRSEPLETIKFVCKELWIAVFKKQIDNLKTNHRGVFVLTDNRFEPLRRCSMEAGKAEEARQRAAPFLYFPAGLIRGALSSLGIEATVQSEVAGIGLPSAMFQIKTSAIK